MTSQFSANSPNSAPLANPWLASMKVGFLGCGNMSQAMIKGLIKSQTLKPSQIFVSNRSPGKLHKVSELYGVQICQSNEELVEKSNVVILGAKPQDLLGSIEPIAQIFDPQHIIVSLAAGIQLYTLKKYVSHARWARVMPNTPTLISKGVIGYILNENDPAVRTVIEDLMSPLGFVKAVQDEDQFEALMVACSSGTGFILELMIYWNDWLEEHGFDPLSAKEMTLQTFLGASELAAQSPGIDFSELQAKVTSKKGVTAAGLDSIREMELERILRISFEKAALRNQEMEKTFK